MSRGALAMLGFALLAEGFWTAILFRALIGVSFAGTYMPGLKLLGARLSGPGQGRAISFYAGSGAIGMALSVFVTGLAIGHLDWRWAAALTGLGPLIAMALVAMVIDTAPAGPAQPSGGSSLARRSGCSIFARRSAIAAPWVTCSAMPFIAGR